MRYPNFSYYKKWIPYHVVFLFGIFLGFVIFLLFYGKELDRLHLQISSLEHQNQSLENDLNEMKETQNKAKTSRKMTVDDVEVHILEPKPDPMTEAELIAAIERDTKYLEGKSLESVNDLHLSLRQQFKDRIFKIGGRNVKTELRTVSIYRTVHLYIYAKIVPTTP